MEQIGALVWMGLAVVELLVSEKIQMTKGG